MTQEHREIVPRRWCVATTKSGKPCKARPLADEEVCVSHLEKDKRQEIGFVGGRKKKPSEVEMFEKLFHEKHEAIFKVFEDGLKADKGVVVGNGPNAYVEFIPDHTIRLAVVKELMDRLIGKPKVSVHSTSQNQSLNVNLEIKDDEARNQLYNLLRQRPAG